jgi:hypothetical protein
MAVFTRDDTNFHGASGIAMVAWILLPIIVLGALTTAFYHRRKYSAKRARDRAGYPPDALETFSTQRARGLHGPPGRRGVPDLPPPCYTRNPTPHLDHVNGFSMLVRK